eukprot:TRINITY_DN30327_c0_g1_i1.p1 TRINITY_DN30327_c0_g1~~TRINITY_DN30327_c0_g1_i1.p1  ORF type:complete len:146 (+),score=39.41 TRINITY_DN30327_c0_g1_i1:504-941(+)
MPPPLDADAYRLHEAGRQHQLETAAVRAQETVVNRLPSLPPQLRNITPRGGSQVSQLEDIANRMKAIEARLRKRKSRAVEEQQRVEQVQADVAELEQVQQHSGQRADEFKQRALALEHSCGSLESEFAEILSRASVLRGAMQNHL